MPTGSGFDAPPRFTFRRLLRNVPRFVWGLSLVIVGTSLWILYFHLRSDREIRETHEEARVNFTERRIFENLHPLDDDLLILAGSADLRAYWDRQDPAGEDLVTQELLRWTRQQKGYFKVRILDERGKEKIKVEFNGGNPRIVPVAELEDKSGRYYYTRSIGLKKGEVYISPLDLDVEKGRIEYPLQPTIRAATPLFDSRNRRRGILVFSYNGQRMLDEVAEKVTDSPGQMQLLDHKGYWLKGMKADDEWGFQISGREGRTFGNAFPAAWERISREEQGTFHTPEGLFVFRTLNALIAVNPELKAADLNSIPGMDEYRWKVVSYVPQGFIHEETMADFYRVASIDGILLLILLPGSLFVAMARVQRQHTEMQLHQQAELIDLAEDSILALTPNMGIKFWNRGAERKYGFTKKEALGRRSYELLQTVFPKPLADIMSELLKEGHWEGELVNRSRMGTPVVNESRWSLQRDEKGEPMAILKISHDIGIQKRLQQELLQAQKLESIGQLAAGIAHEINTPTQFIGDNIRFLKDSFVRLEALIHSYEKIFIDAGGAASELQSAGENADKDYLLDEIPKAIDQGMEGVTRVATLVGAMKEFSHPGTREKTPTDINHAIDCTLTVARNEWKYVARMETDYDRSLPQVPCLRGELNQVVLNLVVNAAHAVAQATDNGNRGKGKIRVQTRKLQDWAEIRIADTGSGIPEEIRSRIFDPFFTTKEVGKGTGQGLAIARSAVVDKHQGTIHFETEEGKGTTFIVRLPLSGRSVPAGELVTA